MLAKCIAETAVPKSQKREKTFINLKNIKNENIPLTHKQPK